MLTVTPMRFSERNSMMAGREQRGVGGQAEIDVPSLPRGPLVGVGDHLLQQRKIHQRLAAEKRDVNRRAARPIAPAENPPRPSPSRNP